MLSHPRPTSPTRFQFSARLLLTTLLLLSGMPVALANTPAAGTVVTNQATGSFTDPTDNSEKAIESNSVQVTIAEIAGITVQSTGVINNGQTRPGDTISFLFTLTNVGNDPTQFFIPNAPSSLINGTLNGAIEIVEVNGTTLTTPTPVTGSGIVSPSVPAGGTIKIRVPVQVSASAGDGDLVTVTMGDTPSSDRGNQAYVAGNRDIYTQDNTGTANGDIAGDPINGDSVNRRMEASAVQSSTIRLGIVSSPSACPAGTSEIGSPNLLTNGNFATLAGGAYPANSPFGAAGFTASVPYAGDDVDPPDTSVSIQQGFRSYAGGVVAQGSFPGDAAFGVPAATNWLYSNGNTTGAPYVNWRTNITGLTPNTTYSFSAYVSNALVPGDTSPDTPILQFRANGTNIGSGFVVPNETVAQGDVWTRVNVAFTTAPGQTSVVLELVDAAPGAFGDDLAISAVGFRKCQGQTISGTVFNDGDGSKLQNGSETGTNAGGLNAVLINGSNTVVGMTPIAADGTYSFNDVPANATYTVQITTATATIGAAPPAVTLPSNWVNTGENLGGTADSTIDGKVSVTMASSNVTGVNLGIEQLPDTTVVTAPSQTNPGGTTRIQVPDLSGTDPEDGALGSGKSFKIVTLPTNGTLYYDGTAVTAGQVISSYDPTKLTLDPDNGTLTVSFAYAAIDAAGQEDPTPATITIPFVPTNPNVLLIKRITAVNGNTTTNAGDDLAVYKDEPANPYDDNTLDNPAPTPIDTDKWLDPTTFLIGGTNGGNVKPSDEIEYTIYFLSAGDTTANSVLFCDRVPQNVTFVPTAFNSFATQAPGGLPNTDRGMQWRYNGQTQSLTNVSDGDAAQYFPPGSDPTSVYPKVNCGGANTNGAVVVNLGSLPNATAAGTPTNSYGFVRFRGRVK